MTVRRDRLPRVEGYLSITKPISDTIRHGLPVTACRAVYLSIWVKIQEGTDQ
ncbi:MAG: hypothetical protein RL215_871 [Planctomycetota bacterium]|jgi:hypothetical protein